MLIDTGAALPWLMETLVPVMLEPHPARNTVNMAGAKRNGKGLRIMSPPLSSDHGNFAVVIPAMHGQIEKLAGGPGG
jgi:hypothetical protein